MNFRQVFSRIQTLGCLFDPESEYLTLPQELECKALTEQEVGELIFSIFYSNLLVINSTIKLFFTQFIALACEHLFTQSWCQMTVVPLNHSNAGAHLYGQRVYIHTIIQKCKCSVGVPKAVKRSILPCTWTSEQTSINPLAA